MEVDKMIDDSIREIFAEQLRKMITEAFVIIFAIIFLLLVVALILYWLEWKNYPTHLEKIKIKGSEKIKWLQNIIGFL